MPHKPANPPQDLIEQMIKQANALTDEMERYQREFVEHANHERRKLRAEILKEDPSAKTSNVELSLKVVNKSPKHRYSYIRWVKFVYPRGQASMMKLEIRMRNKATNINTLQIGAHHREKELIVRHERQARVLRNLWQSIVALRKATSVVTGIMDTITQPDASEADLWG